MVVLLMSAVNLMVGCIVFRCAMNFSRLVLSFSRRRRTSSM